MHATLAVVLSMLLAASSREAAPVRLQAASSQVTALGTLKFDTDACGLLGRVEGKDSVRAQRIADDEGDEEDDGGEDEDYSWSKVWGIPDEVSSDAEKWYSEHPQVAILTDALVRSCDNDVHDFEVSESAGFA
jgi:hypothetical protein